MLLEYSYYWYIDFFLCSFLKTQFFKKKKIIVMVFSIQ